MIKIYFILKKVGKSINQVEWKAKRKKPFTFHLILIKIDASKPSEWASKAIKFENASRCCFLTMNKDFTHLLRFPLSIPQTHESD